MRKYKIVAAALVTASLVGTLTWTTFATKINFEDAAEDNTTISTFTKSFKNLLSDNTADEDSATADSKFKNKKSSGFGMMNSELICEILGITKEELSQKLKDNDGNIYNILEEAGKVDEYKAAVLAKYKSELDNKVADGKITQEKADEMYALMKESIDKFDGSAENNFRMYIGGKANLEDMPEDWKNKLESFKEEFSDKAAKFRGVIDIDAICEALGITKEELSQQLKDNNIFEILENTGKLEEYKASALAKYKAELDKKVADGKLTQEKADEMYEIMKESIDNFDGNYKVNFQIDENIGDKIKEKFRRGGEFTFDFPEMDENSMPRGKSSGSDLKTQGM